MSKENNLETYIQKYCEKHGITEEEALRHVTVKNVQKYYEEEKE